MGQIPMIGRLKENLLISKKADYCEALESSFDRYNAQELAEISTLQLHLKGFVADYVQLRAPHMESEFTAALSRRTQESPAFPPSSTFEGRDFEEGHPQNRD